MDASGEKKEKQKERMNERMGKAKLKENTELYMDMQTGELGLQNPESDTEWEMSKPTSTEKVAYYCAEKGEWNGVPCAQYHPPITPGTSTRRDYRKHYTTQ